MSFSSVFCGLADRSVVWLYGVDEYRRVVEVLESLGVEYGPWPPTTQAGDLSLCGDVFRLEGVWGALGVAEFGRQVKVYTWRFLLFPGVVPWYGVEVRAAEAGGPLVVTYFSYSGALAVGLASLAAGLYSAWRLGRAGRLWHFAVPYAVVGGMYGLSAFFQLLAAAVAVGGGLSPLQWLAVFWPAVPPALYALAFYLAWRRRTA